MAAAPVDQHRRRRRWGLPAGRRQSAPPRRSAVVIEVASGDLPDGWFAFRNVDLDGTTAPLVVAGVRGVFTIDAYATPDRVSTGRSELVVSGRPASDLTESARHRAAALAASIETSVKPLIVFQADEVEEGWFEDVRVVSVSNLRSFLLHLDGRRASWDELKRIRAALARLQA